MKHIFAVMKKELKRFFTDKRMLASLFIPGILIFILYSLMGSFMGNIGDVVIDKNYQYRIVLTNNYDLAATDKTNSRLGTTIKIYLLASGYSEPSENYIDVSKVEEYKTKLTNKEIDTLIVFDNDFEKEVINGNLASSNKPNIKVFYNSEIKESETLYSLITTTVNSLYQNYYINKDVASPNLGNSSFMMMKVFSIIFPLITMSLLYSSTLSICPESIAGEKERGTLASILITPVKRSELAIGKILALSLVSIASGIVSALGIIGSLPKLIGQGGGISISPLSYALLFFVVLSTVILFVTLASLASTFAKTIKEASAYLGPVAGLLIVVALIPAFLDCSSIGTAFIPFVNICQCMSSILTGTMNIYYLVTTIMMNILFSGVLVFFIVKMFNNEKIMFNN